MQPILAQIDNANRIDDTERARAQWTKAVTAISVGLSPPSSLTIGRRQLVAASTATLLFIGSW
jgi:hypothetical protein